MVVIASIIVREGKSDSFQIIHRSKQARKSISLRLSCHLKSSTGSSRRYCNVPTYSLEMYRLRCEDSTRGRDARTQRDAIDQALALLAINNLLGAVAVADEWD
eukprot:scaffold360531_cov35-Attheya_sp.AAC.1